ncbi:MAG: penicillin acylase family protein [Planctomycetota bacterium]
MAYDALTYPHIFSSTDAAAFYAFGRSQYMEFPVATSVNMALASGELAAWIGPGIHVPGTIGLFVQTDVRTWRWRIPQRAVQHDQQLDAPTRAILLAFTQGLNESRLYWLANAAQLANATEPAGFPLPVVQHLLSRPITLLDVLAHGIQMNGNVAMFEADKLANDPEEDYVQDAIRTASNSWLIGATSSASGKPILLADPHLAIDKTTQMRTYFAQVSGSSMDVCGMTFPGWPCIAIGFNSDYGWAVTANNPDIVDVYKAPELPNLRFPYDAGTKPIIQQPLTLGVYDLATQTVGTYTTTIAWAGDLERPILRRCADLGGVQSIWYGHASFTTAGCLWKFFHDMARATDVLGARAALDQNTITYSNFLLGDRFGNKGYFWSGRVPRRRAPTPQRTWAEVQDGTKSAYQWSRVHPASDLPWEYQAAGILCDGGERDNLDPVQRAPGSRPSAATIDPANYPEYMVTGRRRRRRTARRAPRSSCGRMRARSGWATARTRASISSICGGGRSVPSSGTCSRSTSRCRRSPAQAPTSRR